MNFMVGMPVDILGEMYHDILSDNYFLTKLHFHWPVFKQKYLDKDNIVYGVSDVTNGHKSRLSCYVKRTVQFRIVLIR